VKEREELKHFGIATFVGSDHVSLDQIDKYEVSVLGVPDEMGATYRLGMQYAPRAVREHSMWKRIDGMECYDYDNRKFVKTNKLDICDLGDLNVRQGDQEATLQELIRVAGIMREKTFPVMIGGDHSITYGGYIGVKKGGNYKKLGLLQFDAHNDTEPDAEFMPRICHSNQFTKLIKEGHLDGKNMVTIGVRGIVNRVWHDFSVEQGITVITSNEFNNQESGHVLEFLKEKFADCDGVYVTFDMDSLEAAYSEGVGTPKYNGLKIMKVLDVIRGLRDINVVGFDEVELNPVQDASGITSFIAWEILYNFLAVGLNKGDR
jgi:agmatinase